VSSPLDFLTSRGSVSTFLGLFILLLVLGSQIPQQGWADSQELLNWQQNHPVVAGLASIIGGTNLFLGAPFLTVAGVLFFSTTICTLRRARKLFRTPPAPVESLFCLETSLGTVNNERLKSLSILQNKLFRRGYRLKRSPLPTDFLFVMEKGQLGQWGSVLFHFSLLILLIGALVSAWTRTEGNFILTEGQTFKGTPAEFLSQRSAPLPWTGRGELNVILERFVPNFGESPTYASEILFSNAVGETEHQTVRTFQAISYAGRTFYQNDHGFSPRFIVKTDRGLSFFDGFVALASNVTEKTVHYENVFEIPAAGLKVEGQLFPDAVQKIGRWQTLSPLPKKPVFFARIEERGLPVFEGPISLGETLVLKDLQISFSELRYWSGLQMVTDLGIPILYTGFLFGCIGLALRILSSRESLWLKTVPSAGGTTLVLFGTAEKDEALFTEKFNRRADELHRELHKMKGSLTGE